LYADEIGINHMTEELVIDKKTVVDLTKEIRIIVTTDYKDGKINDMNSVILFEDKNQVHISFKPSTSIERSYLINFHRYKEQGNLYSFLLEADSKTNKRCKVNSIDRFLSFAKMKLISYRGIKIEFLKEYLIELVIKFNLQEEDYFDYLLKTLHFQRMVNFPPS